MRGWTHKPTQKVAPEIHHTPTTALPRAVATAITRAGTIDDAALDSARAANAAYKPIASTVPAANTVRYPVAAGTVLAEA